MVPTAAEQNVAILRRGSAAFDWNGFLPEKVVLSFQAKHKIVTIISIERDSLELEETTPPRSPTLPHLDTNEI